jgi:signal transduction histidine kinase
VRNNHTKGPIDLSAEAESVVALFKTRCEARGGRIRCLQTPGLMVDVPSGDIRQILTNLISNASDALSGSGLIDIQMVPELSNATILVRDNGVGIPPENLERIFEPFFTTKDDTGTGIGLWITKELVEKNGGRIYAVSGNLPDGFKTSFCVEFPLYRSEPVPAADGSEPKQDRESIGSGEKDSSLSAR